MTRKARLYLGVILANALYWVQCASHSEPAPCSPADYAALSASCEDCPAEIEARRALCEGLIREDAK